MRWLWMLLICTVAAAQVTPTPNIKLNVIAPGTPNWGIPLNDNATLLDLLLSGNKDIPGLSLNGPLTPKGPFNKPYDISFALINPGVNQSGVAQYKFAGNGANLVAIYCDVDSGTVSINLDVRGGNAPNTPGANVLGTALVCPPTVGSIPNLVSFVPANVPLALDVIGLTGAPTLLHVHVDYQLQ